MPKKNKTPKRDYLAENAMKARKLGLSYGQYMGFVETGYINTYIDNWLGMTVDEDNENIIESNMGAGGSHRKKMLTGTRRA